jgi:hypothetical protein
MRRQRLSPRVNVINPLAKVGIPVVNGQEKKFNSRLVAPIIFGK